MTHLPQPDHFPQYTWRPATLDDVHAIHQLSRATLEADGLESAQPPEELKHLMAFLGERLATNSLLALTTDGAVAAMAIIFILPGETEHRANLSVNVHVAHRGQGVGAFLTRWAEASARQQFATFTDKLPCILQNGVRDHQTDRIQLLETHGFVPTRYFFKMERDLSTPIPTVPLPPELTLTNWLPEKDEAVRLAFNDSFRDHFGFFPVDEALWQAGFTGKPDFRGDLTRLAVDDHGRVIGFCLTSISPERNAQSGKNEGFLDDIGVIRGWRKRGIASALIVAAMQALQDAGLTVASLGVDTENPTGALRLYENLGFQATRRSITFQKELS
jgi:ribosomal protein S18 acetylase RimI-like enzyme